MPRSPPRRPAAQPFAPGPPGAPDRALPLRLAPFRAQLSRQPAGRAPGWTPPPCAGRKTPLSTSCSPACSAWARRCWRPVSPRLAGRQPRHRANWMPACSTARWTCRWMRPARACRPGWASSRASCATARKSIAASWRRAEAAARLTQLYRPYHAALAALMEETRARFGVAVLIDCHSMPSALSVPDIVLGDRYGASAAPALTARAEAAFTARRLFAWRATRPMPAAIPRRCTAAWRTGCHALQIEINRALYLDEDRIAKQAGVRLGADAADPRHGAPDGHPARHWARPTRCPKRRNNSSEPMPRIFAERFWAWQERRATWA